MEIVRLSLIGFVLGITTVIPGLSVGTMAVVFNVYDRLINVIVPNVKKVLAAWIFWLPMVTGGAAGIIFASKIFTVLFEIYEVPTYWFFIGVIAGSIPLIYSKVRNESSAIPSVPSIILCILGIAVMILMAVLKPGDGTVIYTEFTPRIFGLFALGGALAAIAMIIPGISGSFLLLVIGLYQSILKAVSDGNIMLLIPVALGAGLGLLLSAAFVRFLLSKVPRETYSAVLGLVSGSVIVLYPGGFGNGFGIIVSVLCLLAGFSASFFMGRQKK